MEENKKGRTAWIDDEGIICLKLGDSPSEEDIYKIIDEVEKILSGTKGKPRVLVYTSPYLGPMLSRMELREKLIEEAKRILENKELGKVAVFGGDAVSRTITSFIIRMGGFKNMEAFDDEEEARKWLKEP